MIGADRNLRLTNEKAQDVTIKKLTRANPIMAAKFAELNESRIWRIGLYSIIYVMRMEKVIEIN